MTDQEVIHALSKYTRKVVGNGISKAISDVHEYAICAVQKQMPVKPDNIRKMDGGMTEGFCKNCGTRVNSYMKFCDQCGQRLDWRAE